MMVFSTRYSCLTITVRLGAEVLFDTHVALGSLGCDGLGWRDGSRLESSGTTPNALVRSRVIYSANHRKIVSDSFSLYSISVNERVVKSTAHSLRSITAPCGVMLHPSMHQVSA